MENMKNNLYQKIAKARLLFLNSRAKKTGFNQFSNFSYFQLSDILTAGLPICEEVGICPVITFEEGYAVMTVYDADSEATVEIRSPLAESNLKGMSPIQNVGSIETYSRRYLWMALLEVIEPDTIDSQGTDAFDAGSSESTFTSTNTAKVTRAPKATKKDTREAKAISPDKSYGKTTWTALAKYFGYSKDLPIEEQKEVLSETKRYLKESFGIEKLEEISEELSQEILSSIGSAS